MSVHQRPDGRIFVYYRDEFGKQKAKPFGRGEQAMIDAKSYDKHLEADRIAGKRPSGISDDDSIYFEELFKAYHNDRKVNGASKSYLDEMKGWFNNTLRYCPKDGKTLFKFLDEKSVDKLTYADIMKIAEHYGNRSQATRNRYLGYLRAMFRFGIRHNLTTKNPLQGWRKSKEEPRRSQLTVDDLKLIMECAPCYLQWAIEVEFALGTRPGPTELLSLKWSNVNFQENHIEVYAQKTKTWRQIPISPEFNRRLLAKKAMARTEYIIEFKGRKIGKDEYEYRKLNKLDHSFRSARDAAGITYPCEMYDVRHLFATTLLNGGADLAAVSKLMGHASVKMTADVYYQINEREKRRAITLLPSLHSGPKTAKKENPRSGGHHEGFKQIVEQAVEQVS